MPTAPRPRITQVAVSTLLAGGLTVSGLACGGSQPPPANPQADLQQKANQPPKVLLPSNAPVPAAPVAPTPSVTAAPTPAGLGAGSPQAASTRTPAVPTSVARTPATPAPAAPPQPQLNIPAGAQWTIYCYAVKGPTHVDDSARVKAGLIKKTGQPDWYVIHGADESKIYYGFFESVPALDRKNPAEVARAESGMKLVKELKDLSGNTPFAQAVFVSLEAPDPTASADWNLFNVDRAKAPKDPKRAYWSLQIAAFRANPSRKEAAVEMVKDLRAQGVDAFYYHGESISSVCVGHWPASALKAQNGRDDIKDQAVTSNSGSLVASGVPLEDLERIDGAKIQKAKSIDDKDTVTVAAKMEVLDPTLTAMMQKFPHNAINYEDGKRLPDGRVVYNPSFLVVIPRAPGNGLYDSDEPDHGNGIVDRRPRVPAGDPAAGMAAPRERILGADTSRGFRNGQ